MEKRISQQLATLYRRHEALMNLIRALEEYTLRPEVTLDVPFRRAAPQRNRRCRRVGR